MTKITVPFFISHHGCPHTCVFCNQRVISGADGALPTSLEILAKIHTWQKTAADRSVEIAFFGGTFTALPVAEQEQLLTPLQPLLASGEINSIRLSTRPDCIDPAHVRWLAEKGVKTIELGIQSMDDAVLEAAGRGHTAIASENAIRCIRDQGLKVGAQLMPGLPGDSAKISLDSLEKVITCGAQFLRIYPALVLRETELSRRFEAGEYHPLTLKAAVLLCKQLLLRAMRANVDVIRMGLQADEGLAAGSLLSGPWHPAFGQLVRSELYFDLMCQLAPACSTATQLKLRCHPSRVSDVIGQGQINRVRLLKQGIQFEVQEDVNLMKEELAFDWLNQSIKGNIKKDLNYTNEV
ncbi:MAG TPA: radical SAM protein [Desulfuromonadaceae bacterium]|jgi:histone acetyltransferase (RNA polymerase elongator complex component)